MTLYFSHPPVTLRREFLSLAQTSRGLDSARPAESFLQAVTLFARFYRRNIFVTRIRISDRQTVIL